MKIESIAALMITASLCAQTISGNPDWTQINPRSSEDFVWKQISPGDGGTSFYHRIHPGDENTIIESCDMAASYVSHDGGQSFASINDCDWNFPRLHYLSGVDFCLSAPDIGYAGAETNGCFKTTDRGNTWQPLSTESLEKEFDGKFKRVPISTVAVHPNNPDIVWIAMGFPRRLEIKGKRRLPQGLAVSKDGGKTWTHITDAFPRSEMGLSIRILPECPHCIFVGTDNGVYISQDDGVTFRSIAGNLPSICGHGEIDAVYDKANRCVVLAACLESQWELDEATGTARNHGGVWMTEIKPDGNVGAVVWRECTGDLRIPKSLISTLPETGSSPWWSAAIKMLWWQFMDKPETQALFWEKVMDWHKDPEAFHKAWREWRSDARITPLTKKLKDGCDSILLDFHTVRIDPRKPDTVYVSVFNPQPPYGIWKTTDGGKHWNCITRGAQAWELPAWQAYVPTGEKQLNIEQAWTSKHPMNYGTPSLQMGYWDIRKFDLARSNPDVLTFHTHRVTYRSSNGGATWVDISNKIIDKEAGLFSGSGNSNMCVYDLDFCKSDPERILFWMADCGLKVSRDGGKTLAGLTNVMVGSNQWVLGAAFDPANPDRFYAAFHCRDWLLKGLKGRYFLETRDFGKTFLGTTPGAPNPLPPIQPEFTAMIANMHVDPNSPVKQRRILATHANQYRYFASQGREAFAPEAPSEGILESLDGGKSWHTLTNGFGENLEVADIIATGDDFQTLYAAVYRRLKPTELPGGIMFSKDSGRHWTAIPTPIDNVTRLAWKDGSLYICGGIRGKGASPENVGGVFVTTDNGANWKRLLAAPLVSNVAVSPANSKLLYCTVERDIDGKIMAFGIYRSEDGGENWLRVNRGLAGAFNFTTLKFNPSRPTDVWVGTYGSGYYMLKENAQ